MSNRLMSAAVLVALVSAGGVASAELSKKVTNTFKGQLIVSTEELPEGKNDKETIAKIKAAKVSTLTGQEQEDVTHWSFHYAAFLSKTGSTALIVAVPLARPRILPFSPNCTMPGGVAVQSTLPLTLLRVSSLRFA